LTNIGWITNLVLPYSYAKARGIGRLGAH